MVGWIRCADRMPEKADTYNVFIPATEVESYDWDIPLPPKNEQP